MKPIQVLLAAAGSTITMASHSRLGTLTESSSQLQFEKQLESRKLCGPLPGLVLWQMEDHYFTRHCFARTISGVSAKNADIIGVWQKQQRGACYFSAADRESDGTLSLYHWGCGNLDDNASSGRLGATANNCG